MLCTLGVLLARAVRRAAPGFLRGSLTFGAAACIALVGALLARAIAPTVNSLTGTYISQSTPSMVAATSPGRRSRSVHNGPHRALPVGMKLWPGRVNIARSFAHPSARPARPRDVAGVAAPATVAFRPPHRHKRWKFDPSRNPFMSETRIAKFSASKPPRHGQLPAGVAMSIPPREPQLLQRARLIVASYLASLMRGDASTALGHLGLSAGAPVSNLSEGPVVQRSTAFRIVHVALLNPRSARVNVEIVGARTQYYGVYVVQANGPAAWITSHTLIPNSETFARHE